MNGTVAGGQHGVASARMRARLRFQQRAINSRRASCHEHAFAALLAASDCAAALMATPEAQPQHSASRPATCRPSSSGETAAASLPMRRVRAPAPVQPCRTVGVAFRTTAARCIHARAACSPWRPASCCARHACRHATCALAAAAEAEEAAWERLEADTAGRFVCPGWASYSIPTV